MHPAFKNPSVYGHSIGGGLVLLALAVGLFNMSAIRRLQPHKLIVIILLLSLAVSVHGISHIGMETVYKYNPWKLITGDKNESTEIKH
jgi:hypothetical protein